MPAGESGPALHRFAGSLVIKGGPLQTEPARLEPEQILGKPLQDFPAIELELLSVDGHLVPTLKGLSNPRDPGQFWQFQADPGSVWSEPGDDGWSRASFPFMLTPIVEGDTWNGIATFLYTDSEVSTLRYQVVQHSAPYLVETPFIAAGSLEMSYRPDPARDWHSQEQEIRSELADRLPIESWEALAEKVGEARLADFDEGVMPEQVISSGLVLDNVVYAREFNTAAGPHPYPHGLRMGVWSVSKTLLGMVTALRLAQKYGAEIFDYRIADYVEVNAPHDGWSEVTFGDAINMATGIGAGSENLDPNNIMDGYLTADIPEYMDWYMAPSAREMLNHVFMNPNHPWGPGEYARYRDRDIFVLSAALDSLYKRREGPSASVWEMMVEEVYRPLGIRRMSTKFTTEEDGEAGVLFLAWALFMTVEDIARVSQLVQDGGVHQGQQLLHPGKLAEALYQDGQHGLPTGSSNAHGPGSYHMSVWHRAYTTQSGRNITIPHASGYGGMIVDFLPNGMIAFRLKNGGPEGEGMIKVAERIRPYDEQQP
jgi:hypothetical protein